MLTPNARMRLVIGLTAAVGASFLAGCCGGPFGADNGGGCGACADLKSKHDPECAPLDAGGDVVAPDASDSGTD